MGRSPARSIKCSTLSARPGLAHHIFKTLGPARPITFSFFWPDPARPTTFSNFRFGPAQPMTMFRSARPGPHFRPMTCPENYRNRGFERNRGTHVFIPGRFFFPFMTKCRNLVCLHVYSSHYLIFPCIYLQHNRVCGLVCWSAAVCEPVLCASSCAGGMGLVDKWLAPPQKHLSVRVSK